jgi:fatty-acyl-CoA synthase
VAVGAAEGITMKVPLTVGDFLDRAALVYKDRTAVVDEPGAAASLGALTYGQVAVRARGMALALDRMGIKENERVAIVSPNSARFLISFYGVSSYGRVLVPVNFRLMTDEVQYIVDHSGASVLLVDPELDEALGSVTAKERIVLDGRADAELFAAAPPDRYPRQWSGDEDSTASINYTSGTTARPKGVQLTHRNCWLNATVFGWHTTVTDRDVYLHALPMFHCNGWGMPYAVTAMGCKQVVLRKVEGEEILRRVDAHEVSLICGAPAVLAAVLDAADARQRRGEPVPGHGKVRVVAAGAPPPSRTIQRIATELGWEFIQIYGLTETAPLLTVNRTPAEWDELEVEERSRRLSRAGVPAVGVRVRRADGGEILARSNHVFGGYWAQPEQTAEAVVDGWFKTGDGGDIDDHGYLTITDRRKDVIITGGENVSSIEVEDCLYQHPAVAEVAVIGVPDPKWGETVKALVVLRDGASASGDEIIEFVRARLAHFKCPSSIEFRPSLVRTATGKLQKFKLRAPFWEGRESQVSGG